jgi:hypothetical protein
MARSKAKKVVQVPIEDKLLKRIDVTAGAVAESRVAFIREACKQRLKSLHAKKLDRFYAEGYRKKPEDLHWAGASVKLLSKRLSKEKREPLGRRFENFRSISDAVQAGAKLRLSEGAGLSGMLTSSRFQP